MSSNLIPAVTRFLWIAVWVALAIYFCLTLWLGLVGLVYPYQLDYGEGIVLWFAREIAHGHSIYKGILGYPYASSNYPPVSMLLSVLLMPFLGDGYTAGRLLNFVSVLVIAGLIARIVSAESRDARAGVLVALFFVGAPYVYHWVTFFRADFIGLVFAIAGIFFVWKYERQSKDSNQRRSYFFLFPFAFLLSLYTKQSLIAAPAAAFLALGWRDRRAALLFAIALGAIGGVLYLAIDSATHGGFTFGLIGSNATVFLLSQLLALLKKFAFTFAILIAFAVWEWVRRVRSGQFGVLEAYAVTSSATLIFAGRVGAWENYFFEAIAIACVLAGCAIRRLSSGYGIDVSRFRFQTVLPFLLLLQLFFYSSDHDPRTAADLVARDYPANQQLAVLLAHTNGTIISEDMGALVTSGKDVAYYTFQYSSLARSGKWDQSWELNGLRDAAFPLVILERGTREDVDHYRRFTREFVSALDRYYAQTQTIGKYEIYTRAPLTNLQSADFGDAIAMIGWSVQSSNLPFPTSNLQSSISNFQLSIVWQAKRAISRRYTAFVHLEKSDGEKVTQDDREPRRGDYPTMRWASGEMVREVYLLSVPAKLSVGKYALRVGWYDSETGERLPVQGSADDSVEIMTYEVR